MVCGVTNTGLMILVGFVAICVSLAQAAHLLAAEYRG